MYQITLQPRKQADHWRALAEYWKITSKAKQRLEWLIEYNFNRPHQSLDYQTPIEYANKHYFKVLTMTPARTFH